MQPPNLLPFNGELFYSELVYNGQESFAIYNKLLEEIHWQHKQIKMFGKMVLEPRLTSWMGDSGATYTYSGVKQEPLPWIPLMDELKRNVETITGKMFNSALLNYYRDGKDSMGWHRDNEKELGLEPTIASLSFGAQRVFKVRTYSEKNNEINLLPTSGSLLVMGGRMQQHWEHALPKQLKCSSGRINITFRFIQ